MMSSVKGHDIGIYVAASKGDHLTDKRTVEAGYSESFDLASTIDNSDMEKKYGMYMLS